MSNTDTSLLKFPCDFPIKAFGLANEAFETAVLEIMSKHVANIAEGAIRYKHSKDKKYVSITVKIQAQSQQQLDAIYADLSACKHVLMAL